MRELWIIIIVISIIVVIASMVIAGYFAFTLHFFKNMEKLIFEVEEKEEVHSRNYNIAYSLLNNSDENLEEKIKKRKAISEQFQNFIKISKEYATFLKSNNYHRNVHNKKLFKLGLFFKIFLDTIRRKIIYEKSVNDFLKSYADIIKSKEEWDKQINIVVNDVNAFNDFLEMFKLNLATTYENLTNLHEDFFQEYNQIQLNGPSNTNVSKLVNLSQRIRSLDSKLKRILFYEYFNSIIKYDVLDSYIKRLEYLKSKQLPHANYERDYLVITEKFNELNDALENEQYDDAQIWVKTIVAEVAESQNWEFIYTNRYLFIDRNIISIRNNYDEARNLISLLMKKFNYLNDTFFFYNLKLTNYFKQVLEEHNQLVANYKKLELKQIIDLYKKENELDTEEFKLKRGQLIIKLSKDFYSLSQWINQLSNLILKLNVINKRLNRLIENMENKKNEFINLYSLFEWVVSIANKSKLKLPPSDIRAVTKLMADAQHINQLLIDNNHKFNKHIFEKITAVNKQLVKAYNTIWYKIEVLNMYEVIYKRHKHLRIKNDAINEAYLRAEESFKNGSYDNSLTILLTILKDKVQ